MTRFNYAPRRGFTLIELLVVIAIIGIIAALTTAGVMAILRKRPEAADMDEMKLLEAAIGKFHAEHNNTYPPDYVKLGHRLSDYPNRNVPGTLDFESVAILTKIWPSLFKTNNPVPWAGYNRTNWSMINMPNGYVVLQGDQCLVFFLGGAWGACGFSDSATMPIHDPHPKNLVWSNVRPTRKAYYEFPSARLKSLYPPNPSSADAPYMPPNARIDPTSGAEIDFPSFMDNFEKQPFVYFSGGNKGTYNVFAAPMGVRTKQDGTTIDLGGVQPYYEALDAKNRPAKYLNPRSYQIITAGPDSKFGPFGGPWKDGNDRNVPAIANSDWKDNHANFHPSRLGVSQAQ